jgi:hypothetical protein
VASRHGPSTPTAGFATEECGKAIGWEELKVAVIIWMQQRIRRKWSVSYVFKNWIKLLVRPSTLVKRRQRKQQDVKSSWNELRCTTPELRIRSEWHEWNVIGAYDDVDGGENVTMEVRGGDLKPGNVDLISHI